MKRYGQLVKERATLTDETIEKITYGVIKREGKWFCVQCETVQNHHFYQYHSAFLRSLLPIVAIVSRWGEWILSIKLF